MYVANAGNNTVSVLKSLAVEATIPVEGGPSGLAADAITSNIFVANTMSNSVTLINGLSAIGTVPVDSGPRAIAVNPINHYAYVANSLSNTVSILNGTTVIATRPVSATPSAIMVHPGSGYIYVAARDANTVNVLQGTEVVTSIPVGKQPSAIAVDRDRRFVYVTCEGDNRVWVLSGTVTLDLDFAVGTQPIDVVIEPTGGEAYTANYDSFSLPMIQNLPPTISDVTPDRMTVGQTSTVFITGTGFYLTPTILLNNMPLQSVQRLTRTLLTGIAPNTLPVGAYTVSVRTADGLVGAKVGAFMVMQITPIANAIWPDTFANDVTTTVRITGSNFSPPLSVTIGTSPLYELCSNQRWLVH
jgi:YVTN family beta-propeller protein